MTVITGSKLRELLSIKKPLVEGLIDFNKQVGHNGIDLSLRNVYCFTSSGSLGITEEDRVLADCYPLKPDDKGWYHLERGYYKIDFNEVVNVPKDMIALTFPRSSLIRSGVTIESAVWDSGYYGRGEALMIVYNPHGFKIRKGTPILQMVFLLCSEEAHTGYSGRYQGIV
ncbi:MAG: deoxyuridine 5'-triphosphate nucleotidohydrolase [Nitrososphaerales archaeon]|nr:deoxyuridine 5'-triphosphate nucleotidohydrolase [Nitrososphaerales archaeon]